MDSEIVDLNKELRDELLALCRGQELKPLLTLIRDHFSLFKRKGLRFSLTFVASYFSVETEITNRSTFPVGGLITSISFSEDVDKRMLELTNQAPTPEEKEELLRLKEQGMRDVNYNLGFLEPPAGKIKTCSSCHGTGYLHD